MAKRYSLDLIIGKKSTIRFPRSITHTKFDTLSFILPANNVLSEPPFSTAITMKKGDSLDTCDQLNELSYEYDLNFPIKAEILLSSNSGPKIECKTPTIFSIINILYDLDDLLIEKFRINKSDLTLSIANISLAKINTQEDIFLKEIKSKMRTSFANISSYNCRRRKDKNKVALIKIIKKKNIIENKDISYNKIYNHKRDLHFFVKNKRYKKKEKLPLLFERIEVFYDLYDDWDDYFDEYFKDYYLLEFENFINNLFINEMFLIEYKKKLIPQILYYTNNINKIFMENNEEIIEGTKKNMYLLYMLLIKNIIENGS